jgi:putative membrane protein
MGKKILVLCVDRDDDLGKKAKIKGPFIGEKDNLKAAETLVLADPTESDANAIFQAVKTYRELKEEGEDVEVATLVGHRSRSSKADREVKKQLEKLLEKGFESVIFVSDGADDEQLLPVIQSRVKVDAVKTVLVKQTKELEKSYYVIKEALRDPFFSRLIFGAPGLVALIYALAIIMGMEEHALKGALLVGGAYFVFRGFGIEEFVSKGFTAFKKTTSMDRPSFPLYTTSILIFLMGIWTGFDYVNILWKNLSRETFVQSGRVLLVDVAGFIVGFIPLFSIAVVLFFAGRMLDMYYRRDAHLIKRYARLIVSTIAAYVIIDQVGRLVLVLNSAIKTGPSFGDLVIAVMLSIILMMTGLVVIKHIFIRRYVERRVGKGMEVRDSQGEKLGEVSYVDYKNRCFYYSSKEEEKNKTSFGDVLWVKNSIVIPAKPGA